MKRVCEPNGGGGIGSAAAAIAAATINIDHKKKMETEKKEGTSQAFKEAILNGKVGEMIKRLDDDPFLLTMPLNLSRAEEIKGIICSLLP